MPILSADGTYVTVEKGDSLWKIASMYLGGGANYKQLLTYNPDIQNENLIYVGQIVRLSASGSAGSPAPSVSAIKITQFGLLSTSDDDLFATWTFDKPTSEIESYKVLWTYDLGNGIELEGNSGTISVDADMPEIARQSTFTIPSGARFVYFKVKPIAKTKGNNSDTRYWTIGWSEKKTYTNGTPLGTPDAPDVKIEDFTLTASLNNIDIPGATTIVFQVVRDNFAVCYTSSPTGIHEGYASYYCTIDADSEYKVRCYAYHPTTKLKSDWSPYTQNYRSIPVAPSSITKLKPIDKETILIEWAAVKSAETYEIQYSIDKKEYLTNPGQGTTGGQSGIETTSYTFYNLTPGKEYFFRVRAVNDQGESEWTPIQSVIIGEKPNAPTTWSSTTTAIVGEPLVLYWLHNPTDGSSETHAQLEYTVTIGGVSSEPVLILTTNDRPEDKKDDVMEYTIDTSTYPEGAKIEWRVRTLGILVYVEGSSDFEFGDWSAMRTVDIYAKPTLSMQVLDANDNEINEMGDIPLRAFPFYMKALPGPPTQNPIGYHVRIMSNQVYETVDNIGNAKFVNSGEDVYSKYFDITNSELDVMFTPGDIDLENSMSYTAYCQVSMDSGLTAESVVNFTVAWDEVAYTPNAEISIDLDKMTASIRPYCELIEIEYYKVSKSGSAYIKTSENLGFIRGTRVNKAKTITGELVYSGMTTDGAEVLFCEVKIGTIITDVTLSVYRREYDGKFTELASGIDGAKYTTITDPHPALDYARYRIVASSNSSGAIGYYDLPGVPVGSDSIIIQWDDAWSNFDVTDDGIPEQPEWSGSMLKLPYNVDVSESPTPDVSFVEYAGREHPVSYYGTQVGESASWSVSVPKSDKETIYALRRLAKWMGNVYVREPSGVGYWANVTVSFSQKHTDPIVPVSFNIRRVEGGV